MLPTSAELQTFLPEILLAGAVVGVLLVPIFTHRFQNILLVPIAATAGLGAALLGAFDRRVETAVETPATYFGGMLVLDHRSPGRSNCSWI